MIRIVGGACDVSGTGPPDVGLAGGQHRLLHLMLHSALRLLRRPGTPVMVP